MFDKPTKYLEQTETKYLEQTETKQFKRWFGDSKVVDEDGKPLVVYHGTDADFTVFDREKLGQYTSENTDNEAAIESAKVGFWFSENDLREKTGNKKMMEVYSPFLLLQNPVKIRSHIPAPKGLPSDPPA